MPTSDLVSPPVSQRASDIGHVAVSELLKARTRRVNQIDTREDCKAVAWSLGGLCVTACGSQCATDDTIDVSHLEE